MPQRVAGLLTIAAMFLSAWCAAVCSTGFAAPVPPCHRQHGTPRVCAQSQPSLPPASIRSAAPATASEAAVLPADRVTPPADSHRTSPAPSDTGPPFLTGSASFSILRI
jgi:hypothetical protein